MAISDKLNYLIETKNLFKDRLNSLGAEIIESTTFRNYLNWLDAFYGDASNKTDLARNGVVGRTSQDGEPTPENPVEINNLSGDVEYKVRGQGISESFPLSLGDIELCAISNYKDRIYSQNGEFYLEKKIDRRNENSFASIIIVTSTLSDNLYGYACQIQDVSSYSELGAIISNIFVPKILGSQTDTTNPNNVRFNMGIAKHTWAKQVVITIDKKYLETGTTTEFSNFLNNNNFEYYCVLATPTTEKITQETYPTLYSQLLAIQEFLTKYKINKEFLLDYSSPEIEY